jgi:hypothetical protein
MKARPFFFLIVVAFVATLAWAVRVGAGDPPPTTSTAGPEPLPEPPRDARVGELTRQLTATKRARRRDRYHYRHALRVIVRQDVIGDHWLERAFLCVHSGEGRWSSNTRNGYFGGLQMDYSFQRAYGREFLQAFGTADHWPRSVQITVAIRAYLAGRGFYPWPNTAQACGLIR